MASVMKHISDCGKELRYWNETQFGLVQSELNKAQQDLQKLQVLGSEEDGQLQNGRQRVQKWLERDELTWRQRSKALC